MNTFLSSGTLFIWLCGTAVVLSLFMVGGVLLLIMVNGLGFFWPATIYELTLNNSSRLLGELKGQEIIPHSVTPEFPTGHTRLRLKVGNRDLYGLDFRWVDDAHIVSRSTPQEVVVFERREWGNFYGYIQQITQGTTVLAVGTDEGWSVIRPLLEHTNTLHDEIKSIQTVNIGNINYDMTQARLDIRALNIQGIHKSPELEALQQSIQRLEDQYQQYVEELRHRDARLAEYSVLLVDVNGREHMLPLGQIVSAIRPNDMGIMEKCLTYLGNVWTVLYDEPREANTEGGIFPAIFGTVLMVLIMSVAVVPFGVLAAFYLKEYARQGVMVRIVRIAVNNLAGVPSIVFGVFGLGFFVYMVGGTIDHLWYPEALPTPTFGTGGLLWASLTLALMTVPVVIVATEESLSAVPREYREGSLALGATKFESMCKVILPCALPGILTGFILAVARATGEVAPLMLTGVVKLAPALPLDFHAPFLHLDQKFMHLGFHIYDVGFQSPNVEAAKPMVYVTTLILVMVVIILNITAIAIRNRMRRKFTGSAV